MEVWILGFRLGMSEKGLIWKEGEGEEEEEEEVQVELEGVEERRRKEEEEGGEFVGKEW